MKDRRRRYLSALAAWTFGLGSSVLLIGMWGRSVVADTGELSRSLTPLATSELVADRVASWLERELLDAGLSESAAGPAVDETLASPELTPILEEVVVETVAAAASAGPSGASVDIASILRPKADVIAADLRAHGVAVAPAQVTAALEGLDPLVILTPDARPYVGPDSPLATNLGTAAILGALLMLVAGWGFVVLAPDRGRAFRSLMKRFAMGALSFAVLLAIGSWIVDPTGGRAPVGQTIARLVGSKVLVPLGLGLSALVAAAVTAVVRRRVRAVAVRAPG